MGSAYDHQRTALIDAIALGGLPLKWPWMADSGKLIMAVNHCGIHSVMAQPVMLFGIPSYEAGAGIEGLVFIMMMLTVAALAYYLLNKKLSWVFLILVFWIGAPGDFLVKYVSPFWKGLMAPGEYYKGSGYDGSFGFWPISSDFLWSPHCAYSGTITLLLIFFYCILLKEREKKRAIHLAAIMGGMAAAAFMGNVYSGMMALFIFFVSLVPVLVLLKDFRADFLPWRILPCQCLSSVRRICPVFHKPKINSIFFSTNSSNALAVSSVYTPVLIFIQMVALSSEGDGRKTHSIAEDALVLCVKRKSS